MSVAEELGCKEQDLVDARRLLEEGSA
jgi:hypothetical protein